MKDRIIKIRSIYNLKKNEFAKLLGISPSAIGYIESGVKKPSADTLVNICKTFKINANWLLLEIGDPLRNEIIKDNLELNQEGKKLLEEYKMYLLEKYPAKKEEEADLAAKNKSSDSLIG